MVVVKVEADSGRAVRAAGHLAAVPRGHAAAEAGTAVLEGVVRVREDVNLAVAVAANPVGTRNLVAVEVAVGRVPAAEAVELVVLGVDIRVRTGGLVPAQRDPEGAGESGVGSADEDGHGSGGELHCR